MDALLHGDGLMLERLGDFLSHHPPRLDEVLGAACELYRTDPSQIEQHHAKRARDAFCYAAVMWTNEPTETIGHIVQIASFEVAHAARAIKCRVAKEELLRDDLDLIALRLAQRVFERRRARR